MIRFLHAADIHLDSPRGGLERDPDAPVDEIRQAPRRALENMVQLALDENVDFVLISGDVYDGDWKDFRTGLFFVEQMARLRETGTPVVLIAGNHDAANRMTKSLRMPDNVTMLSHRPPKEPKRLEKFGVAIHGQSFAERAVLDDLSLGYPGPASPHFSGSDINIGLLHTCGTGSSEHECYAPCKPEGLQRKQYDYWALGHIHKRGCLHCDGESPVWFPGNLQGRHIREDGPKGCLLVTIADHRRAEVEFRPVDVFRWERCPVDATGLGSADEVCECVERELKRLLRQHGDLPVAVRVEVSGVCRAHEQLAADPHRWAAEVRGTAFQVAGGQIWIERLERRTSLPRELDEALLAEGPVGDLLQYMHALQADEPELKQLAGELDDLLTKLPSELTEGIDSLRWNDPETLRLLLDDSRQLLTYRLLHHQSQEAVA